MSSLMRYRRFFSVQMLIDYYLTEEAALYQNTTDNPMSRVLLEQFRKYRLENDLLIVPTAETRKLLSDKKLIFKRDHTGFLVGGQVEPMGGGGFMPVSELTESFSLHFAVYLKNPLFYNFTNLRLEEDLSDKDRHLYYFTNRADNEVNGNLYLSRSMPSFDPNQDYEASELIVDNSDPLNPEMLEAIENNGPGAFNAANWRQIFPGINPLFQFVGREDRIVTRPSVFKHDVAAVSQEILVFHFTNAKGRHAGTIVRRSTEAGTPLSTCELDLSTYISGFYSMTVFDGVGTAIPQLSLTFFMDDELYSKRPFAVIECIHEPDGSLGDYRWFDHTNQDQLRDPVYTIRWKNRATWWRYYHEDTPDISSPMLEHLDPLVNSPNHRILISTSPVALTQLGREVTATATNGDLILLPNPGVETIYPEGGRIFSELNMGGGYGPPA